MALSIKTQNPASHCLGGNVATLRLQSQKQSLPFKGCREGCSGGGLPLAIVILNAYLLTTQIVKELMLSPKAYVKHYPKAMLKTKDFSFRLDEVQTPACIAYLIMGPGEQFTWKPGSSTQYHSIKVTLALQLLEN